MAAFELNIYGENDEILKTYSTSHIRWGLLKAALELQDSIKDDSISEQVRAISAFAKEIFIGLTDAELDNAASEDVIANFKQLTRMANKIVGSKNA